MEAEDHEALAKKLEQETEKLERESARLEQEIEETRSDWHAKQADASVPGAVKPSEEPEPGD